jgi:hypothetical protein
MKPGMKTKSRESQEEFQLGPPLWSKQSKNEEEIDVFISGNQTIGQFAKKIVIFRVKKSKMFFRKNEVKSIEMENEFIVEM